MVQGNGKLVWVGGVLPPGKSPGQKNRLGAWGRRAGTRHGWTEHRQRGKGLGRVDPGAVLAARGGAVRGGAQRGGAVKAPTTGGAAPSTVPTPVPDEVADIEAEMTRQEEGLRACQLACLVY